MMALPRTRSSSTPSRPARRALVALALTVGLLPVVAPPAPAATGEAGSGPPSPATAAPAPLTFSDVGDAWAFARPAIAYVAEQRNWMRDFGTERFRPRKIATRGLLARTLVRAFDTPPTAPAPAVRFTDLPSTHPLHPFAAIAVSRGWMRAKEDRFRPEDPVTIHDLYRALVMTLPLQAEVNGLRDLRDATGYRFEQPATFPTTLLGMRLGFRYNHRNEHRDLLPAQPMPRAEVAYALHRRATLADWQISAMSVYRDVQLPQLSRSMRQVVEFSLRYVGYPYVWGGHWHTRTASQRQGGFDCSGLMWWTVKAPNTWYDPTPIRKYRGWNLPQRTSATMASKGTRIGFNRLEPGNLMFYDGDGNGGVDHVNLFLGNGWAMDSSSGIGGVTLLRVSNGWYRERFTWGRRLR
jgi:cell wall-associated NlpC family hydrolase